MKQLKHMDMLGIDTYVTCSGEIFAPQSPSQPPPPSPSPSPRPAFLAPAPQPPAPSPQPPQGTRPFGRMNMPFLLLSFFDDIRVARVCIRARGPYLVQVRPHKEDSASFRF